MILYKESMTIRAISKLLNDFQKTLTNKTVSVNQILEAFHERGFGFALLLFAAPMALPLPVPPGINIILASPLILLTSQQMLGRRTIWLPHMIKSKTINAATVKNTITAALPWLYKIESLIRPRLGFITHGPCSNIIGLIGLIMALTACIPLPLTNTVPSAAIALMAIGVVMRDGLAVILGALIGLAWVALLAYFALTFGAEGLDYLKELIKSWM